MLRFVQWLLRLALALALTWVVVLAAILVRLYQGPLSLAPYHAWIEDSLKVAFPGLSLEFKEAYLSWEGFQNPLYIELKDPAFHMANQRFQANYTLAEIRLRSLIIGQFLPTGLRIKDPVISLNIDILNDNRRPSAKYQESLATALQKLLMFEKRAKTFKRLSLENAKVVFLSPVHKEYILDHLFVKLDRTKQGIRFETEGKGENQLVWKGEMAYDRQDAAWTFKTKVRALPLQQIIDIFNPIWGEKIGFDARQTLDVSVAGSFTNEWTAEVYARLGAGLLKLDFSPDQPLSIPLKGASLKVGIAGRQLLLKEGLVAFDHGNLDVQGLIEYPLKETGWLNSSSYHMRGLVRLSNCSFAHLKTYWPAFVAAPAYKWIITHIPLGTVPQAHLALKGNFKVSQGFDLEDLGGQIELHKAKIFFLDKVPPLEEVSACASYSPQGFSIEVKEGTLGSQTLQKGWVHIHHMDRSLPHMDINVSLQGSVEKALGLLSDPALNLLNPHTLPFKIMQGHHQTRLNLAFPVKSDLLKNQIEVGVQTSLSGLNLLYPLKKNPLALSAGEGRLLMDRKGLSFKGKALVQGNPLNLEVQQSFQGGGERQMTAQLKTFLTPSLLKVYAPLGLTEGWAGKAPLTLTITQSVQGVMTVDANAALKDMLLKWGVWEKPRGSPLSLEMRAIFEQDKIKEISSFHLMGKGATLQMKGWWDKKGSLEKLDLIKVIIGKTNLSAKILKHRRGPDAYDIKINGQYLDVMPLWDAFSRQRGYHHAHFDLEGHIDLRQLALKNDRFFYHTRLSFRLQKGDLSHLSLESYLSDNKKDPIFFKIHSPIPKVRSLTVQVPHGGMFLKRMGIIETIEGGNIKVSAMRDENLGENIPWKGQFIMSNFKLKKAPFLGRLLSLAFPTGFADFLQGNKMTFDRLKLSFQANKEVLSIRSGRAYGPSLGFSVFGMIYYHANQINLSGSILPAYHLNTFISKIPLIGRALTGGKNEGLFGVAYRVKGALSQPTIAVNPLSAFTPGFLRRLFMGSEGEDLFEDSEEDQRVDP